MHPAFVILTHRPYGTVGFKLSSSCSVHVVQSPVSCAHSEGVINQTPRPCETQKVFLDPLLLFAHPSVASPSFTTNHSHRETGSERWSAHCSGSCRLRGVCVWSMLYVVHLPSLAYVVQNVCDLMLIDIWSPAVFSLSCRHVPQLHSLSFYTCWWRLLCSQAHVQGSSRQQSLTTYRDEWAGGAPPHRPTDPGSWAHGAAVIRGVIAKLFLVNVKRATNIGCDFHDLILLLLWN